MPNFSKVASLTDLPPGTMLGVVVDDTPVALYNVDGTVYATHDICSHARAHLSQGTLCGHVVECPLHGAKFDVRTGKQLSFPAVVPVKRYEVRVDGDDVLVALA